ncbi:MAG: GntR family transcriptional regulator [bacterium]
MRSLGKSGALSLKAKEKILAYIKESDLRVDDALPTEAALMKMLGVSRHTVREALALLEQERIVYRVQGKGTFLKRRPLQIEQGLEKLESITEIIESCGLKPSTRWIGIEVKLPGGKIAEQLQIDPQAKIITFKRLRLASGNLASYCVDSMPVSYFDSIPYTIEDESVFSYLEREKGIYIQTAVSYVIPTAPTREMVEELGVDEDQLFILLEQLHYDNEGKPLIYSLDYFQPDVIRFKINRTR